MKRYINVTKKLMSSILACAVLLTACNKEEILSSKKPAQAVSNQVVFGIKKSSVWSADVIGGAAGASQTKSSSSTEMLHLDCADSNSDIKIFMHMIEEDCPEVETASIETKAEGDAQSLYEYGIYAFHDYDTYTTNPEVYVPANTDVVFMNNYGLFDNLSSDQPLQYWPGYGWLQFYAYSPYIGTNNNNSNVGMSVVDNNLVYSYTALQDYTKHIDLLAGGSATPMTGNPTGEGENELGQVDIDMFHILSKVQFKLGSVSCGDIEYISLKGIKNGGTYSFVDGQWTLTTIGSGSTTPTVANYTQPYRDVDPDAELVIDSETKLIGNPYYFVPQDLTDATIEIKINVKSTDLHTGADGNPIEEIRETPYILTKSLSAFTQEWSQNKQYTYVLSSPEEIEIDVTDRIEYEGNYPVKKNLVITNTGLSTALIRVALVGSWCVDTEDAEGNEMQVVVSNWKSTDDPATGTPADGEFTWGTAAPTVGTTNANNWQLGSDGFYYYMKQVLPGEKLIPLFESYKLTAKPPMPNAYLELTVSVDAIYPSYMTEVWPEDVTFSNTSLSNL